MRISCRTTGKNFYCRPFHEGEFMLSENQQKIFSNFHKSVEAEGILDERTSHLIKVAACMSSKGFGQINQKKR